MTPDSNKRRTSHDPKATTQKLKPKIGWFCPGVRVHKGITIVFPLLRSHCLALVYYLGYCIGSCIQVHKDRTDRSEHIGQNFDQLNTGHE